MLKYNYLDLLKVEKSHSASKEISLIKLRYNRIQTSISITFIALKLFE